MSKPKKITLADGKTVKYRIVIEAGCDPVTGKRKQLTRTFDKLKDANAELARVRHERNAGTYVAPSDVTVNAWLDEYLKAATFEARASTARNYADALRPVRERLGARRLQSLAVADIEAFKQWMLTEGRRRGGKPGTGLGARSVRLTLTLLSSALQRAVDEGRLVRNVAAPRLVKPPKYEPAERESWSASEVRAFLAEADADRLAACWRLSLYGLRRGEVLGLRWSDIDLKSKTLTVRQARVLVGYEVLVEEPKSRKGHRTLPLDEALVRALTTLRKLQMAEAEAAGLAYGWGAYIACDELGEPVHPEWYSDEFGRLLKRAGLRRIVLHGARHTINSLMEKAGVPDSIRAAWCGHTVAVNRRTYVHTQPEDLIVARDAVAAIHQIG